MVDTSRGIKKSNFPVKSVPTGGFFDYTLNGVNYKIALTDMITAFGTTGTIQQEGDAGDTPVLDDQGSVKGIRNIASGQGIVASIDGNNSVEIKSGIQQDPTGTALFDDLTLNMPTVASFTGGTGITVEKTGDVIDISVDGSLGGGAQRVLVQSAADLSGALDGTKQYFIDGVIDMGAQTIQVPAGGLSIAGYDFDTSKLISSENNFTLFTSPGGGSGSIKMRNVGIEITGTGSQVYNISAATGAEALEIIAVNYNNCTSLGTISGYRQCLETGTGRFGGKPALALSGTWSGGYRVDTSIVRALDPTFAGALFEEGASFTMASRFFCELNVDLPASAALLDFQAANFVNSETLQIVGSIVSRNGVFDATDSNLTPNISETSVKSQWSNNRGLPNTFEGGALTITGAAATVIVATPQFYDLNGTWTTSDLTHFSEPVNGQLRHDTDDPRELYVEADLVITGTAGDTLTLKIVKYDDSTTSFSDVITRQTVINNLVSGTDTAFVKLQSNVVLDVNDYVKVQVQNDTAARNVTASVGSYLRVGLR